jgi:hypothetical protein
MINSRNTEQLKNIIIPAIVLLFVAYMKNQRISWSEIRFWKRQYGIIWANRAILVWVDLQTIGMRYVQLNLNLGKQMLSNHFYKTHNKVGLLFHRPSMRFRRF